MTVNLTVPVQQQPVAGEDGRMTLPWYRYLHNLQLASGGLVPIPTRTLLGNSSAVTGVPSPITVGNGLTLANGMLSAVPGGSGTVTSVALALPTDTFTLNGSPVTQAGTLGATYNTQAANVVHAGPISGALATPTWRALDVRDIPVDFGRLWVMA